MNELLDILASMIGPAGHVIQVGADDSFYLGDLPVADEVVHELLQRGYVYPTRQPCVTGSSLTGRLVLSGRGRRYLAIMRERAA